MDALKTAIFFKRHWTVETLYKIHGNYRKQCFLEITYRRNEVAVHFLHRI